MFQEVTQRHEKVLIIGGGESLCGFDWKLLDDWDGVIITVNNVVYHLPRADYWITVDPMSGGLPQRAMREKINGVYYYCAFPDLNKDIFDKPYYETVEGIHYLERIVPEESYKLQEDKDKITTGDSCYGALGLAYHFEAKLIIMLGVDVNGGYGHWYDKTDPYNREWGDKFGEYQSSLPHIYEQSVEQFQKRGTVVINGSLNSAIDCFTKMKPEEAIKYIP
jgi:hypothetical protein